MLESRLQHQDPLPCVFRFDRRFFGDGASDSFTEQISHAFDTTGRGDVSGHPLHGPRLYNHIIPAGHVYDKLSAPHAHFGHKIVLHGIHGVNTQVSVIFQNAKVSESLNYVPVLVFQIIDLH